MAGRCVAAAGSGARQTPLLLIAPMLEPAPPKALLLRLRTSYNHHRTVTFAQDKVDLAPSAPWRSIIALQQLQSPCLCRYASAGLRQHCRVGGGGVCHSARRGGPFQGISLSASFATALAAALMRPPRSIIRRAPCTSSPPIGNLADITLRALHVLQLADTVACGDAPRRRCCGPGIDKSTHQLLAVHQHNKPRRPARWCSGCSKGQRGVRERRRHARRERPGARAGPGGAQAGLRSVPLPGPAASPRPSARRGRGPQRRTGGFVFCGVPARQTGERAAAVQVLAGEPRCVVLLEAPHRIRNWRRALAPRWANASDPGP